MIPDQTTDISLHMPYQQVEFFNEEGMIVISGSFPHTITTQKRNQKQKPVTGGIRRIDLMTIFDSIMIRIPENMIIIPSYPSLPLARVHHVDSSSTTV